MMATVNSRSMVNTAAADPIVAIATGPGRGGIGIVRVSGAAISPIVEALLGSRAAELVPRCALYSKFVAGDGAEIDHGIALYFPAPQSYTGENVLELQGHGGPVVLRMLLARCLQAGRAIGLRIAQPGEFTQRAFLNDRLDLAQAEAVADLIDATTEIAARAAVRSLAGEFSRRAHALTSAMIELRVLVEATLDFPEEELDFLQQSDAAGRLARIRGDLDQLLKQAQQGALLRDGLNIVLVGAPNVGKSSLMNTLAGADIAIVTAIPGTTRDRIEQQINVDGIPLNVIDTAGLREAADEVEQLGIARTLAEIERADVVAAPGRCDSVDQRCWRAPARQSADRAGRAVADGDQQDRLSGQRAARRRQARVLVGQDRRGCRSIARRTETCRGVGAGNFWRIRVPGTRAPSAGDGSRARSSGARCAACGANRFAARLICGGIAVGWQLDRRNNRRGVCR